MASFWPFQTWYLNLYLQKMSDHAESWHTSSSLKTAAAVAIINNSRIKDQMSMLFAALLVIKICLHNCFAT